jgi:polyphenol oxidase
VLLSKVGIPVGIGDSLAMAFPGESTGPEPIALLSFASLGDMKFGDPRCAANRERFLHGAGIDPSNVRGLELVHSRTVLFLSQDDDPALLARREGGADGLLLRNPGLAASVTVADCMPIWILDRESGAFGVLHSGWRGTGIIATAIRLIAERFGSEPSSIAVILGPAIGPCCYEVSEERKASFSAEFGEGCVVRRGGADFLDLRSANISLAERNGIGNLLSIEACTSCDKRLGSYRREGSARFTRMLAVCGRVSRVPNLGDHLWRLT